MKKKKFVALIVIILLFAVLHWYNEWKVNHEPQKGMTERLIEWGENLGWNQH